MIGELIYRDGVHPALAAPLELQLALDDALANVVDAFRFIRKWSSVR